MAVTITKEELKDGMDKLGAALQARLEEYKAEHREEIKALEKKMARAAIGLGGEGGKGLFSAEETKAFETWARTGEVEKKAMSIANDPSGGYLVPAQLASEIASVGAEQGAIRNLARVYTPSASDFSIPIATNLAAAGRTTETGTRANTATPDLAKVHPMSGGMYAVAPVTSWLLNDAGYNVADFITESIGTAFGVTESADFVSGDGNNKASGFLTNAQAATADATRTFGTVEKLHAGSTSTFDVDTLITLLGKLAPRYRKNAAWIFNADTEAFIRKIRVVTNGEYAWQPSVQAGVPPTLLGIPAFVDVNMPSIASAAAVVALADWRRFYAIVDIGPLTMLRDPYTSKGNTLFYAERRTGGAVVDSSAGKLLVMSV